MKTMGLLGLCAALCLAFPGEALALHRCVGKDGKVTYTDLDCDADAKKSAVTIHDSAGVGSKDANAPGRGDKPGVLLIPNFVIRPAEVPRTITPVPTAIQQAGHGSAQQRAAPAAAAPGEPPR